MKGTVAIIVCYNSDPEHLAEQYNALKDQVEGIIYVDNGSIQNSFTKIIPEECKIIRNSTNIGLGAAQNQGIKAAIKRNATHILLLDDDSVPSKDMVSNLLMDEADLLSKNYQIGLVGALIVDSYTGKRNNTGFRFSGVEIKRIPIKENPISVSFV